MTSSKLLETLKLVSEANDALNGILSSNNSVKNELTSVYKSYQQVESRLKSLVTSFSNKNNGNSNAENTSTITNTTTITTPNLNQFEQLLNEIDNDGSNKSQQSTLSDLNNDDTNNNLSLQLAKEFNLLSNEIKEYINKPVKCTH